MSHLSCLERGRAPDFPNLKFRFFCAQHSYLRFRTSDLPSDLPSDFPSDFPFSSPQIRRPSIQHIQHALVDSVVCRSLVSNFPAIFLRFSSWNFPAISPYQFSFYEIPYPSLTCVSERLRETLLSQNLITSSAPPESYGQSAHFGQRAPKSWLYRR